MHYDICGYKYTNMCKIGQNCSYICKLEAKYAKLSQNGQIWGKMVKFEQKCRNMMQKWQFWKKCENLGGIKADTHTNCKYMFRISRLKYQSLPLKAKKHNSVVCWILVVKVYQQGF